VAALACWWDWRLLNALYCLLPVREPDSVALDYYGITNLSLIAVMVMGTTVKGHSGGSLSLGFNPQICKLGGDYHLSSTLTISDSLVDDSSCFESLGNTAVLGL